MWKSAHDFEDVLYEKSEDGQIAKITINRPEVRNAFRPETTKELLTSLDLAHEDPGVGVIILTGAGDKAFCSGGDQKVRGHAGYIGGDGVPRLNILDVQRKIRNLPKPVVATCCKSFVTSVSLPTMPFLVRQDLRWDLLMVDWVPVISPVLSVRKRRVRFGFSAASMMPSRRWTWAW